MRDSGRSAREPRWRLSGALLTFAATAQAQRPAEPRQRRAVGQSGIQLYNFNDYLQQRRRRDHLSGPAGRSDAVLRQPAGADDERRRGSSASSQFLQARGIKNVELYGYPGNPFPGTNPATPLNIAGLQALRALGDQYGLRFPAATAT